MSEQIFCTNCATEISVNIPCGCGATMTTAEKNRVQVMLRKISDYEVKDSSFKILAHSNFKRLPDYNLSSTYFRASSAKDDYDNKVNFLKHDVIENTNKWGSEIQEAEKILRSHRLQIQKKVAEITDFILTEFFGPFAVKKDGIQNFIEFSDSSKYHFSKTLRDANISLEDLQTTTFESVGVNVFNAVEGTLSNGSFKEIAKNGEWSKTDRKVVGGEIAVAIGIQLITGGVKMVGENMEAISRVREADQELSSTISLIDKQLSSLKISENEAKKRKQLFQKYETVLDTCFKKTLKPIFEEVEKDEIYKLYRKSRLVFDLQQEKISLDRIIMKEKVKVSFWRTFFSSGASNYENYWNVRANAARKAEIYEKLNLELGENDHQSLTDLYMYEKSKTEEFKKFELVNRRKLKKLPVFSNNKEQVLKFAAVLKIVKSGLTN